MSYRKGLRYRNDKFDYDYSNIYAEGADRILYEVFLQKSDEWIYEQEHRIILRLEQADKVLVPNINEIVNLKIKALIQNATYTSIDHKTNAHTVNLFEISDEHERIAVAMELATLNQNPKVIYSMQLSPSSINNCLIGLRSNVTKDEVLRGNTRSANYLNVWKAKRNFEYYSLEFEQI